MNKEQLDKLVAELLVTKPHMRGVIKLLHPEQLEFLFAGGKRDEY